MRPIGICFANDLAPGFIKPEFKVWKTIRLGTGPKTAPEFCDLLENKNYQFLGEKVREMLSKPEFSFSEAELDIDLVNVSVQELGFTYAGATYVEARGRGQLLGLDLCPAEVGPQLRLQYPNQSKREWKLNLAMKSFDFHDSGYYVFCLGRVREEGKRCLMASRFLHDSVLQGDDRLIFVKPRKQ